VSAADVSGQARRVNVNMDKGRRKSAKDAQAIAAAARSGGGAGLLPVGSALRGAPWPMLRPFPVDALEAMRAEEIALRLDQIRRAARLPPRIEP